MSTEEKKFSEITASIFQGLK